MVNLAGSTEALDTSLNTIYSEFKLLRDETGVMRSCATMYRLQPHTGTSKNVLNYGRVVAYSLPDGQDMQQSQALADAVTSYTPSEVGAQVVIAGSTLRRVADPDLEGRTSRMLNNAYDLKEDGDGCDQLSSFTPVLGSAGTVIGVGHAFAGSVRLMIGNNRANPEPAPKPHFLVLHPLQGEHLLGRLVPLTDVPTGTNVYTGVAAGAVVGPGAGGAFSDKLLKRGLEALGTLSSFTVKFDANINVDSSDDASGAGFSEEGLVYVEEVAPQLDPDKSNKSMRGAVELNIWGSYAWGLYRPAAYGVEYLFDATLPTS